MRWRTLRSRLAVFTGIALILVLLVCVAFTSSPPISATVCVGACGAVAPPEQGSRPPRPIVEAAVAPPTVPASLATTSAVGPPPPLVSSGGTAAPAKAADRQHFHVPVLYGMESCPPPQYAAMVDAQLSTWAAKTPREAIIVVGGPHDDVYEGIEERNDFLCGEKQDDLACKEALMLYRAARRAKSLGSDWLVVSQDDKYIWKDHMEQTLAGFDGSVPTVFGGFGCGRGWKYTPASKNGTLPKPRGFVETAFYCEAVHKHGGICGGVTFFISRGALDILVRPGQTAQQFHDEFMLPKVLHKANGGASDSFSSCIFYNRSIPMSVEKSLIGGMATWNQGQPNGPEEAKAAVARFKASRAKRAEGLLTIHLTAGKKVIPDIIRALHETYYGDGSGG